MVMGRNQMKFIKYIAYFILPIAFLFLFIANFSSTVTKFECQGHLVKSEISSPETIYLRLEKYKWWIVVWGDSDGELILEIPNTTFRYFSRVKDNNMQLRIYDNEEFVGALSSLSKVLAIKTHYGFFDGKCHVVEES
jgi:hypothetical protein